MEQYVSKSALVAEICKRRNNHFNFGGSPSSEYCHEDDEILGIIDTLEVKEMQEEPVSEEFEKALAKEWQSYIDRGAATVDSLEDNTQELAFAKGFYRGSKWQKKQDQETIELAEDHAMLAGMEKMKEQMMKDAIKCEITWMDGFMLDYTQEQQDDLLEKIGVKVGDKVNLVIIKEDEL